MMRFVRRVQLLVVAAALSLLVSGCAHTLEPGAVAVRVECNISGASVYIDDLMVGSASEWKNDGHQIRAGFHRIEIRAPGYYSFFQEIELPAGAHAVVRANLREVLD